MKTEIRKKALEKRDAIPDIKRMELSLIIEKRLRTLSEYKNADSVLLYHSIHSEVRTHQLIQNIFNEKKILLPVTDTHERKLLLSQLFSHDDLVKGKFNVMEPANKIFVDPNTVDLLVIPGVAFDETGNRIGYGKGYYDTLLKEIDRSQVKVVALAYECQIFDNVPYDDSDELVDIILTEDRVIRINKI